jgi:hypothetical protein
MIRKLRLVCGGKSPKSGTDLLYVRAERVGDDAAMVGGDVAVVGDDAVMVGDYCKGVQRCHLIINTVSLSLYQPMCQF